jgi:hypothetical protein
LAAITLLITLVVVKASGLRQLGGRVERIQPLYKKHLNAKKNI